ncbi:hypothetical protein MASR2M78_22510 [Treponema sp.]
MIRDAAVFADGSFTTKYSTGIAMRSEPVQEKGRYRWIEDRPEENRYRYIDEGSSSGRGKQLSAGQVSLFVRGQPVALNRVPTRGASHSGAAYLGTDILGSIRSLSDERGNLEDRYEYDAFGKPYSGDFDQGQPYGYTGKPYGPATGLVQLQAGLCS